MGSTRAVDVSGDITRLDYAPFGEDFRPTAERYKFIGKEDDGSTGLQYFNARYYAPAIGRFITEDSAKDGINWYVYCGNSPLRYVDPDGRRDRYAINYYEPTGSWIIYSKTKGLKFIEGFISFVPAGNTFLNISDYNYNGTTTVNSKEIRKSVVIDLVSIVGGKVLGKLAQGGSKNAAILNQLKITGEATNNTVSLAANLSAKEKDKLGLNILANFYGGTVKNINDGFWDDYEYCLSLKDISKEEMTAMLIAIEAVLNGANIEDKSGKFIDSVNKAKGEIE